MARLQQQVGDLIRHHRERAGITQSQLAELTGRSVEMIGRLERGGTSPSFETLAQLSLALTTPVRDFFGAGAFEAAAGRSDPLQRLVHTLSSLDQADLEWIERLLQVALGRKVRTPQ
jgi:transcriptional regulator with XRE-family HTH domain